MKDSIDTEQELLRRALRRFDSKLLALVLGVVFALGVFVATNWLVVQGGHLTGDGERVVGPHLEGFLRQFFIGYRVSFWGSLIGALYGFVVGTIVGSAVGWIYNRLVDLRH